MSACPDLEDSSQGAPRDGQRGGASHGPPRTVPGRSALAAGSRDPGCTQPARRRTQAPSLSCQSRGEWGLRTTHTRVLRQHGGHWGAGGAGEGSAHTAALPLTVGTGGHPGVPAVRGLEGHHSSAHGGAERLYLTGTTYRSWSLGRWRLLGWKGPKRLLAPARVPHRRRPPGLTCPGRPAPAPGR